MNTKRTLSLFTLLSLFVITQWTSTLFLPVLPKIANEFTKSVELITSSLSYFFIAYATGQLLWGTLSDYIGRYFSLIISIGLYLIILLLLPLKGNAYYFTSMQNWNNAV